MSAWREILVAFVALVVAVAWGLFLLAAFDNKDIALVCNIVSSLIIGHAAGTVIGDMSWDRKHHHP